MEGAQWPIVFWEITDESSRKTDTQGRRLTIYLFFIWKELSIYFQIVTCFSINTVYLMCHVVDKIDRDI